MSEPQHLDAERLAAFMEGSLSRAERASVEAHAAGCDRCLQLLAAMARTEPPLPAAARGLFRPFARWAVPLAAAATAVALWVSVDRNVPPPPPAERTSVPASPTGGDLATARAPESPPARSAAEPPSGPARSPAPPSRQRREDFAASVEDATTTPQSRGEAAKQREVREPAAPAPLIESGPRQESRLARRADLVVEIVSPDPLIRWRAQGGLVEGSTDGGRTWSRHLIVPDVQLRAGASTSREVAWLVGSDGCVLRATNGRDWQRQPFPERAGLVAVRAAGAAEAHVTTEDGRVFRTTDGGRTWALQEIPGPAF